MRNMDDGCELTIPYEMFMDFDRRMNSVLASFICLCLEMDLICMNQPRSRCILIIGDNNDDLHSAYNYFMNNCLEIVDKNEARS